MKINEIFIPVRNYGDSYLISNYGRIKSLNRKVSLGKGSKIVKELILNPIKKKRGYLTVGFWKDSERVNKSIHRLVAEHFIPNPENKPQVNHIDGNKENNTVENLEWCTAKENITHSIIVLNRKKGNCKPIMQLDVENNILNVFDSFAQAGRFLKTDRCKIANALNTNSLWKGYKWKYVD